MRSLFSTSFIPRGSIRRNRATDHRAMRPSAPVSVARPRKRYCYQNVSNTLERAWHIKSRLKARLPFPKRYASIWVSVPAAALSSKWIARGRAAAQGWRGCQGPRARSRFAAIRGTRKTGMSTDEIMNFLRGYDGDALDPGLRAGKK